MLGPRNRELLLIVISTVVSVFCTVTIFRLVQRKNAVLILNRDRDSDNNTPFPRLKEMPSFVMEPDAISKVSENFLTKMQQIAECQLDKKCPKRVLVFKACSIKPCQPIGDRLFQLASAFYLAYADGRFFHISGTTHSDLSLLFQLNEQFYSMPSIKYKQVTGNYTDLPTFESEQPTDQDLERLETIVLAKCDFFTTFTTNERYQRALAELFAYEDENQNKRWAMALNSKSLVAVALRIILANPTERLTNLATTVWQNLYQAVDPPRGRVLIPGGRSIGNDGITRFGIYASFPSTSFLNEDEKLDVYCLIENAFDLATYHGMVNGIGGVLVGSDSEEARKLIVEGVAKRGIAAVAIDDDFLAMSITADSDVPLSWRQLHEYRALVELALISRMDVILYNPSTIGDLASSTALIRTKQQQQHDNRKEVPVFILSNNKKLDQSREGFSFSETCRVVEM